MALVVAASSSGAAAAAAAAPDAIASVPAASGSRLFFTWGAGTQIQLCELQGKSSSEQPSASTVAW